MSEMKGQIENEKDFIAYCETYDDMTKYDYESIRKE